MIPVLLVILFLRVRFEETGPENKKPVSFNKHLPCAGSLVGTAGTGTGEECGFGFHSAAPVPGPGAGLSQALDSVGVSRTDLAQALVWRS